MAELGSRSRPSGSRVHIFTTTSPRAMKTIIASHIPIPIPYTLAMAGWTKPSQPPASLILTAAQGGGNYYSCLHMGKLRLRIGNRLSPGSTPGPFCSLPLLGGEQTSFKTPSSLLYQHDSDTSQRGFSVRREINQAQALCSVRCRSSAGPARCPHQVGVADTPVSPPKQLDLTFR